MRNTGSAASRGSPSFEAPISPPLPLHRLHPAELPDGTVVGPWRVLSRQALGGYGAVYLAQPAAEMHGEPVALKVALHPNDPRFLREAELLRRNPHPHVPRLYGHGLWEHPAGPFPFLAMQWVGGVPLYQWAYSRSLTSRLVMRVVAPVAGALARRMPAAAFTAT